MKMKTRVTNKKNVKIEVTLIAVLYPQTKESSWNNLLVNSIRNVKFLKL